jgi:predicted MFS family arabinose efflux permease
VALCFSVYSSQWLAVVGFMPTISHQMGWSAEFAGAATAFVALVNVTGNVGSGHLLQRGWAAKRLLWLGFTCMASGAILAFLDGAPVGLRFAGVLVFSACGGLIPGTLFSMAVQLAPSEDTVSSTVGWVQQLSAVGQFVGPPLVAWVAAASGGWHYTGWVCAACSLVGMALAWRIHQSLLHKQRSA